MRFPLGIASGVREADNRPSMWSRLAGVLVLLALPVAVVAEVSTVANPVYHGGLDVGPLRGTIALCRHCDGSASVIAGPWILSPVNESNGVFPAAEPIVLAIGEESFRLEPGMVRSNRKGTLFSYRAPRGLRRGIRYLRMRLQPDGSFAFRFALRDIDLSSMKITDPVCKPFALIVGDDDGFISLDLTSRSFSRRLAVRGSCVSDWPWQ